MTTTAAPQVHGVYEQRFAQVREVFQANFTDRQDLGAAVAVYHRGRPVVDLWAGTADAITARPWERDTPTVIFSCSKGLITIAVLQLVTQGRVHLDQPVADLWPDFARHDKDTITTRQVLDHSSGLLVLDADLTASQIRDGAPVVQALADQAPVWAPGTSYGYHAQTMGWLAGEVVRRVTGLPIGRFLTETISRPLGVATVIGAPTSVLDVAARVEPPLTGSDTAAQAEQDRMYAEHPWMARALTLGGALPFPGYGGDQTYNDRDNRAAELPAANGISTARDLARIYAACIAPVDGVRLLDDATLTDACIPRWTGPTPHSFSDPRARWGTGFMLASPTYRPMLGPASFGHDGAGGNLAFADPDHDLAFAYLTNQMGGIPDDRANALCAAVRAAL